MIVSEVTREVTNKIVGDCWGRWEPNDRGFSGVVLAANSTDLLCDYGGDIRSVQPRGKSIGYLAYEIIPCSKGSPHKARDFL